MRRRDGGRARGGDGGASETAAAAGNRGISAPSVALFRNAGPVAAAAAGGGRRGGLRRGGGEMGRVAADGRAAKYRSQRANNACAGRRLSCIGAIVPSESGIMLPFKKGSTGES